MQQINRAKLNAYMRLMRLDKPVGIYLLLWPTLWALWIASNGLPYWQHLLIFVGGTVLMRSAGCIFNDIADRKFDGKVLRTKNRPLVNAEISPKQAYQLAACLSLIAFLLVLQLNSLAILLSVPALVLAITYPYFKRFFPYPQVYLGIAFGFGVPMAFAAVQNQVPVIAWWIWIANLCWTLAYDTMYAMVDREYDLTIGLRSSAISFGRYDVAAVMIFHVLFLILMILIAQMLALATVFYLACGLAACLSIRHYVFIRARQPDQCLIAFQHSHRLGLVLWLGLVLAYC